MNRNQVMSWTFGAAAVAVLASGLAFNGPFDLELGFGGLRALMLVFGVAALVLVGVALVYVGASVRPTLHGLTRTPLIVAALSVVLSAGLLNVLEFNVHLYGPWVMLFTLVLLVSGLAVVLLAGAALWGLVVRRRQKTIEGGQTG